MDRASHIVANSTFVLALGLHVYFLEPSIFNLIASIVIYSAWHWKREIPHLVNTTLVVEAGFRKGEFVIKRKKSVALVRHILGSFFGEVEVMLIVTALICVCCSSCSAGGAEEEETPGNFADPCAVEEISERKDTANNLPRWIEKEKIRAGFVSSVKDTKYAAVMRTHGLNTIIVVGSFHRKREFADALKKCSQWARAGKKAKLHVFVAYMWQPAPKSWSLKGYPYRAVVYSDGNTGIAPCPRDDKFWQSYLIHLGKVIAEISLEPDLQIDGIFLDCELYGSYSRGFKSYGECTCFCDNCFSNFLLARGFTGPQLPAVEYPDRKKWLEKNGFLDSYFTFLANDVEKLAEQLEKEVHAINPKLVLGMYPHPKNWVLKSVAMGIGTSAMPAVLFATDTYINKKGAKIPDNPQQFYASEGINAVYVAGYLLRRHSSQELRKKLPAVSRKCSGYWLFVMQMLWEPPNGIYRLAHGSPVEYWQAIRDANNRIDVLINQLGKSNDIR